MKPRPHSRAYQSLDLNKSSMTAEEEAMNQQSYQSDKCDLAPSKSAFLHKALRSAIIDAGIFGTNEANAKMKEVNVETGIPDIISKKYFDLMSCVTKERLTNDKDYKTGRYQFSDQFTKK